MPGRLEFDVNFSTATQGKKRRSQSSPMHILLMGDFSGDRDSAPGFPLRRLDLDNYESLMAKLAPQLRLQIGTETSHDVELEFQSLDHFHPDSLLQRLPLFQQLRALRAELQSPETFAQAAAQLRLADTMAAPASESSQKPVVSTASTEHSTELLDKLLGERPAHIASEPTTVGHGKSVDISAFIRSAVAPHIESGPHPQRDEYIASVDLAIGELMRNLLHHPRYQALEAVWRGAYECVSRLELDESLKVYVLDLSKTQLQQHLQPAAVDLTSSAIYQSLVEQTVQILGGEPWALMVGLYSFSSRDDDRNCLQILAKLAHDAGGPFVAAADPQLLGCDSTAVLADPRQWRTIPEEELAAWQALRGHPYAGWLGLIYPRFLLRLPYGAKGESTERFTFEEIPADLGEAQRHECYLWGNGAVAAAVLIGQSFLQNGWDMQAGDVLELDDLPWYVYEQQGEKTITPCAEALLSERAADRIESLGVMPLMSYKDRNAVRLWRFRSLSPQNPGLSGAWNA